jgi:glycosidase/PKD repeat protein
MFNLRQAVTVALLGFASTTIWAEDLPAADGPGGITAVKSWAGSRLSTAEADFNASGHSRMPSPNTWSDQVVYQIQVDRFNNGDTSNDGLNIGQYQQDHRFTDQKGMQDYRHGGDLQGIINRMDYLKDLGVTALWVTPVLKGDGSYHGYCTADFTQIDPGFGTNQKLRELTAAAHARGIRVVLDIVVNHMCSNDSGYAGSFNDTDYTNCTNDFESMQWNGTTTLRGQRSLNMGASFFPPFRSQHFFSRCGNKAGDFAGHGPGALWGDFSDKMFDLNTLNWDFQDVFTDLHKWWIAYADIDGFRLDATKHVSADFVAKLSTDARAYAKALGKDNFYIIGEVADNSFQISLRTGYMRSDINNPANSTNVPAALKSRLTGLKNTYLAHGKWSRPGQNGAYDFAHSGTMVDAFRNTNSRTPLSVKQYFYQGAEQDHATLGTEYADLVAAGDTGINWNIMEIHDWPRFALWSKNKDHLKGAVGYLMAARGAPVLYYGVEQGFHAGCDFNKINLPTDAKNEVIGVCNASDYFNHSRYRQDMFIHGPWRLGSVESSINNLSQIGFDSQPIPASWETDPYLKRDHDMYKSVRKLIHVRKSCPALNYGQTYFRQAWSNADGLLAFSRVFEGKEILVVQNFGPTSRQLTTLNVDGSINGGKVGTTYRNLLNGYQRGRVNAGGGSLSFHTLNGSTEQALWINAYGTMIFVHESNVANYDSYLETHLCGTPVVNQPPVANAGADITIQVGQIAQFNGSASSDSDGTIASYSWNDGSGAVTGVNATKQYNAIGTYTVTLTVTDNSGATATDTVVVKVTDANGFVANYPSMFVRGTNNSWAGTTAPMSLEADNQWKIEPVAFGSSSTERFKFDVKGDWAISFGDNEQNGVAEQLANAADIKVTQGAGNYKITFNSVTRAYTITKLDGPQPVVRRTVIYIYGQTVSGQDMYLRGGVDWTYAKNNLGRDCGAAPVETNKWLCAIPITHRLMPTETKRVNDRYLDWYGVETGQGAGVEGSPLVWTTNNASHPTSVAVQGYGYDPENTFGPHYWKLDVDMDCTKGVLVNGEYWVELKSYISNGPGWEANVSQAGAPYVSGNHFAKCGFLNKFERGSSAVFFRAL